MESTNVVMEKPSEESNIFSFQALMVSTASRVGIGSIGGVSTTICPGGYGTVFWMWSLALLGGASAFIESTLAQIYKKRDENGGSYGGPAYYIENALHSRPLAIIFSICLISTFALGYNALASYNLQSTFAAYSFYNEAVTPAIIGLVLAVAVGICIMGGGKRVVKIASAIVPFMGISYVLVSLLIIVMNIGYLPTVFANIFADAFNFKAIFSGVVVIGIHRCCIRFLVLCSIIVGSFRFPAIQVGNPVTIDICIFHFVLFLLFLQSRLGIRVPLKSCCV